MSDIIDKVRRYLAHSVPVVLLIHPQSEWVRRFAADGSDITLSGDDRIDLDDALPGLDLTVRALFDTLRD